jgi:hypothetical protein
MTGKTISGTSYTLDMMRALKAYLAARTPGPLGLGIAGEAIVVVHAHAFRHYIRGMGRALDIPLHRVTLTPSRRIVDATRGRRDFGLFVDHAVWECHSPAGLHFDLEEARARAEYVYRGKPFDPTEVKPRGR